MGSKYYVVVPFDPAEFTAASVQVRFRRNNSTGFSECMHESCDRRNFGTKFTDSLNQAAVHIRSYHAPSKVDKVTILDKKTGRYKDVQQRQQGLGSFWAPTPTVASIIHSATYVFSKHADILKVADLTSADLEGIVKTVGVSEASWLFSALSSLPTDMALTEAVALLEPMVDVDAHLSE